MLYLRNDSKEFWVKTVMSTVQNLMNKESQLTLQLKKEEQKMEDRNSGVRLGDIIMVERGMRQEEDEC